MGFYYHPPGEFSRSAVLDIGLKCTHSCKFCYYSFLGGSEEQFTAMRRASFRDGHKLKTFLSNLRARDFLGFDVTGGEPTLHPDLVDLIAHATDLGLMSRVITLGQFLMRKMRGSSQLLIDDLLGAGVTNFLFSFHSSDEAEFANLTGEKLGKQLAAMDYLGARDFEFTTNTVVVADNAKRLPEIARALTRTNTYLHNFIVMNSYYEWNVGGRSFNITPRYTDLLPYLQEAIAILAESNIGCNIRYAPLCGLPGLEKHIVGVTGVRYDPYEWMNCENHAGEVDPDRASLAWPMQKGATQDAFELLGVTGAPGLMAVRGRNGTKVFPDKCASCTMIAGCDGFDPKYTAHNGVDEASPYDDPGVTDVLVDQRRSYVPPFLVKLKPDSRMRAVNKRFLNPEPMARQPKVSIVITAYNKESTIVRAARSALDQTYQNLEVVIVDDGSVDGTCDVLKTAGILDDGRVVLVRQANSGQPATARNAGIAASTGALILPLDGDDWIQRSFVTEATALLAQNPSVSIAYSDVVYSQLGIVKATDYNFSTLIYSNQLSYCSLYKRQVFDDIGGYRTNVRGVEDWDFWVAAGALGHFGKRLPRPLMHYQQSTNGVYAQDVANNMDRKFAQIISNNASVYQPGYLAWARQTLASLPANPIASPMPQAA